MAVLYVMIIISFCLLVNFLKGELKKTEFSRSCSYLCYQIYTISTIAIRSKFKKLMGMTYLIYKLTQRTWFLFWHILFSFFWIANYHSSARLFFYLYGTRHGDRRQKTSHFLRLLNIIENAINVQRALVTRLTEQVHWLVVLSRIIPYFPLPYFHPLQFNLLRFIFKVRS